MRTSNLRVKNLTAKASRKTVLKNINLEVKKGEVCVIMGPNGSGKSSLAQVIMGNPGYKVASGKIFFGGRDITKATPTKRAQLGIFGSFQYPKEIEGLPVIRFLRMIHKKVVEIKKVGESKSRTNPKSNTAPLSPANFRKTLKNACKKLEIPEEMVDRYLNHNFSGGEKKKMEILQMLLLKPQLAVIDEVDSGLDVDALKTVAKAIKSLQKETDMGVLLITHYSRILKYLPVDKVYVMVDGEIIREGGKTLVNEIESNGFNKRGSWSKGVPGNAALTTQKLRKRSK